MEDKNMIIGLQIIAMLFAFSMIYFALHSYKRGELNGMEMGTWLVVWSFAIGVVIFPEILRTFASTFLLTRVFDLMVIGGFLVVITLVTSSYVRTKRLEKKVEEMVRREAIKKLKGKK